jgi:excisionase family DNA binding protein
MSAAERLLTVAQAAERSECSVKTLRRAIAAGDLAAVRVGSTRPNPSPSTSAPPATPPAAA